MPSKGGETGIDWLSLDIGSGLGSMTCPKCEKGVCTLEPWPRVNPLDTRKRQWVCGSCKHEFTAVQLHGKTQIVWAKP